MQPDQRLALFAKLAHGCRLQLPCRAHAVQRLLEEHDGAPTKREPERDEAVPVVDGVAVHRDDVHTCLPARTRQVLGALGKLVQLGLDAWAASGLTAVVLAGLGYALVRSGMQTLKPIAPTETVGSLKETAQWLKNETR